MSTQFGVRPMMSGSAFFRPSPPNIVPRSRVNPPPKPPTPKPKPATRGLEPWQIATALDRAIVRICCKYGITLDELMGGRRYNPLAKARSDVFAYMAEHTNLTRHEIGWRLNMDHSSVSHALATRRRKALALSGDV